MGIQVEETLVPISMEKPQMRTFHDASATFEEYHYYSGKKRTQLDSSRTLPVTIAKPKRAWLTLTVFQNISRQESQYAESLIPRTNFSSNIAPSNSDTAYIDRLCGHGKPQPR